MYTIDELSSKDISELVNIAKEIGADTPDGADQQSLIYAILDKQAVVESEKNPLGTKRRRTRIQKKDTDRVYSVNGKDGENFDTKKQKAAEPQQLFKDIPEQPAEPEAPAEAETAPEEPVKVPKKRGRKSKAELAAMEAEAKALEEQKQKEEEEAAAEKAEMPLANEETAPEDNGGEDFIPEQEFATSNPDEQNEEETNLIQQLQAKVNAHNEGEDMRRDMLEDSVWEGDPGDGTDFIISIDLPIEDQSAMPMYDMFDNPTTPIMPSVQPMASVQSEASDEEEYDFADIIKANGVLEIMPDGYGFIRSSDYNYLSSPDDVYVSQAQVKRYGLKTGDVLQCNVRPPREGEKYFPLTSIDKINGREPSEVRDRVAFEHLTPLFPDEKYELCGDPKTTNLSTRIVDLFAPIGKGQRALIVAQPKTGKTILMKDIANAIAANHPEAYLMMLLIDERPEEVTDMARTVNAEVIASTFDEPAERHVKIAGIVLEKAKRMVECGHDVVIFLDSITRLARAYNTVAPASGKVLTGGVDANALQKPKRFFGAARNIEGGGSLTIIATALIDTGSKMDEVIFEEFKGTGNMELQLDRSLSNKRIFPAVNLVASSTRRDDLLQDKTTLDRMWILRKYIADMTSLEAMDTIHDRIERTRNNDEFLLTMNS
ncbi:MAG: transcription termination factor Rho [Prevotellaceae bacterium]|nr:transcription termination factor Rho [Prevotellaceae bacterium]